MTDTQTPPREPGAALLAAGRFFRPGPPSSDLHGVTLTSMVSHAAGARYHALIGAPMLPFYDWYADLPVASPQVFGDQTDVPVPRTPDAYWIAEARFRGQKVVVVAPDHADNAKFLRASGIGRDGPTAAVGDARRLEESALSAGCSLDYEGGPGMGGDGPADAEEA